MVVHTILHGIASQQKYNFQEYREFSLIGDSKHSNDGFPEDRGCGNQGAAQGQRPWPPQFIWCRKVKEHSVGCYIERLLFV